MLSGSSVELVTKVIAYDHGIALLRGNQRLSRRQHRGCRGTVSAQRKSFRRT
jgi:hypothetical protein